MVLAGLITGCALPIHRVTFEPEITRSAREDIPGPAGGEATDRAQPVEPPALELPENGGLIDLSIEQAMVLALGNNRDLLVQQLNPVIVGTFEQIERGRYHPEVFAELTYFDEQAGEISYLTGDQIIVERNDTETVAGVRQALPTGTTVEATVGHDRTDSSIYPDIQTARIGLSITQSLLRGFGPAVNLVGVRQAELDIDASVYELRGFTEALLADTETAYWHYVLAKQEIEIFERSLTVARQQRDEVEHRIEVGLLPATEAAAARAEVARHEQSLIDARSLMEERRLRILRLTNPGSSGRFDLRVNATSEPRITPEPITDLDERIKLAEQSRPDLNETRLRIEQSRLETVLTRNGLLPKLELFIAFGRTGFADTFSESFRELNGDTHDFTAGIRFSHFLGNRAERARHLAARASRRQAAEALENLRQIVQLDVRIGVNEVERARQQITATRATRELQEQTLLAEKERFDVGASTALLVAQAQRDLLASSIAEVKAVVNYRISLIKLYLSEGSLLERRGVLLVTDQSREFE